MNRIFGNGNAILGKLKELEKKLQSIPREALKSWKKHVDAIKSGAILDRLKAEQLKQTLEKIPLRTSKDAAFRIIGNGNAILAKLKVLESNLRRIPRDALRQWKTHTEAVKKGALLDGIRAQKLKSTL